MITEKNYHLEGTHVIDRPDNVSDALERYDFEFSQNKEAYYQKLWDSLRPGEITHAVVADEEASKNEGIVWQRHWGGTLTPSNTPTEVMAHIERKAAGGTGIDSNAWTGLILADCAQFVMKELGHRAEDGGTLSVTAISAPSRDRKGYGVPWSGTTRSSTQRLGESIHLVAQQRGLERIHAAGPSLGATAITELVRLHADDYDFASLTLMEQANMQKRLGVQPLAFGAFAVDYMFRDKPDVPLPDGASWIDDDPEPRTGIAHGGDGWNTMADVVKGNKGMNAHHNLALVWDMSRGRFNRSFETIAELGIPTTLESATGGKVTKNFDTFVKTDPSARKLAAFGLLQTIKVIGAPHLSNESIALDVTVLADGISFAQSAK